MYMKYALTSHIYLETKFMGYMGNVHLILEEISKLVSKTME